MTKIKTLREQLKHWLLSSPSTLVTLITLVTFIKLVTLVTLVTLVILITLVTTVQCKGPICQVQLGLVFF